MNFIDWRLKDFVLARTQLLSNSLIHLSFLWFQHDSTKESYDTTQVALSEQPLMKTNRKPIQNQQSKTVLLFKTYTQEFEFRRHPEHMVSCQGMQNGLPVFHVGEHFENFYRK